MAAFAVGTALLPLLPGLSGLLVAFAITGGASGALDISLNNRTARVERDTGARLFNRTHALFPAASLAAAAVTGWARGAGAPLGLIFALVVMVVGGGNLVYTTLSLGQTSAAMHIPLGYIYAIVPVSGLLIMFFSVCNIAHYREQKSLL